ncbi:MAG: DUF3418 domain-containing protein, partial [Desulfobacteraceae bacterium]|nr:DUF3418 domain-containing protein [Desulfobacteraceae bacterium]
ENLENKTRKRDILASEDDIYLFYHAKLPKPFYNIRTFARFLKDQGDDAFLKMKLTDLQKESVNEDELVLFPDTLAMDQASFRLEYAFDPGSLKDGVTIMVPEQSAELVSKNQTDRLVPGLFEEKICALIKNLPKKYRVKLVPANQKAAIIAQEMPKEDKPLFSMLSVFVKTRFNTDVPPTAWSEENLHNHLKMRFSIRDKQNQEIKSFREKSQLNLFRNQTTPKQASGFEKAKSQFEKDNIIQWNMDDIKETITLKEEEKFSIKVFLGLKKENSQLALRLFKSKDDAIAFHSQGIRYLFEISFANDFKSLKKDINAFAPLKKYTRLFNGTKAFQTALYDSICTHLFALNIRTRKGFFDHAQATFPILYTQGRQFLKTIEKLCEEYDATQDLIKKLSLKYQKRPQTFSMISALSNELKSLIPDNFLALYSYERIKDLQRYAACIRVRVQRTCDDPSKEMKKAKSVKQYTTRLQSVLDTLTSESSKEKAIKTELFYWMLEEYKISVFAQELGTRVKISPKKLDAALAEISLMI